MIILFFSILNYNFVYSKTLDIEGYQKLISQWKSNLSIYDKNKNSSQFSSFSHNLLDLKPNLNSSIELHSDLGTEVKNKDNWITINHDIFGTRFSNQTEIGKNNVSNLHIKWELINDVEIQDPPIIIGKNGYVQDYAGYIIAFNAENGQVLWKVHVATGPTMGLTFDNGLVFASTGYNASVVALNATNGNILWQSPKLGPTEKGYNIPSAPLVWKKYVVVGSAAGGDVANGVGFIQGNITALNIYDGKILWNLQTTAGDWVDPHKSPLYNGDASAWSDGSLDPKTGILYIPLGSPSPNFNASSRQNTPNLYANHMIAVNITNGKIVWTTPFIDYGTVLPVTVPDTHDWDTSWGSSVVKVNFENGTQKKVVIGHDKMGNIMAMDAANGRPIWWRTLGKQINTNSIPLPNGSGMVWSYGIFNYHAVDDNNTLYLAATNRGVNYFTDEDEGEAGHRIAAPNTIELGLKNGSIAALDLKNGNIKWQYPTEFPPRVSPLVTNGIVFAGAIPFTEHTKANSNHTTIVKDGQVLALDKDTGKKLWEFIVNAPISTVGPSIGDGMLFITTGKIQNNYLNESRDFLSKTAEKGGGGGGGAIIAFGLS